MRRRGQTTSFQERLEIGEKAAAGYSDPRIAGMLGCSVPTVRKWRRRYQKHGRAGLVSKIGFFARPLKKGQSKISPRVSQTKSRASE